MVTEVYEIDGKAVSRAVWDRAFPDREGCPAGDGTTTYPHLSLAVGVHSRQAGEAMAHAKKHGVPTDFTPEGKAVFTSREHRRKYLRLVGAHDNNAYGRV